MTLEEHLKQLEQICAEATAPSWSAAALASIAALPKCLDVIRKLMTQRNTYSELNHLQIAKQDAELLKIMEVGNDPSPT